MCDCRWSLSLFQSVLVQKLNLQQDIFDEKQIIGGAIASIYRRPASLDLGLAFRWPISGARRQMRGDRIKCLGLRTDRTSCINATDSICRRARMESQSVVKRGQWARVDDKSNRSRSACGNATCGTFQHVRISPRLAFVVEGLSQ